MVTSPRAAPVLKSERKSAAMFLCDLEGAIQSAKEGKGGGGEVNYNNKAALPTVF